MFVRFFFKQKTAYEMRISDWSSDVCSSDLNSRRAKRGVMIPSLEPEVSGDALTTCADVDDMLPWPSSAVSRRLPQVQVGKRRKPRGENPDPSCAPRQPDERGHLAPARLTPPAHPATGDDHAGWRSIGRSLTAEKTARTPDRKSVVEGQRGHVGVDRGGSRCIQKKNQ